MGTSTFFLDIVGGDAGQIIINADSVTLSNSGTILTEGWGHSGGNIVVTRRRLLKFRAVRMHTPHRHLCRQLQLYLSGRRRRHDHR